MSFDLIATVGPLRSGQSCAGGPHAAAGRVLLGMTTVLDVEDG
jgi:hypothetical protein